MPTPTPPDTAAAANVDAYGLPTAASVAARVGLSAPDAVTNAALLADIEQNVLPAVIAHFESPPVPAAPGMDGGGAGRRLVPVAGTRTFDGSGWGEQRIDDLVISDASPAAVTVWGSPLAAGSWGVKGAAPGDIGRNTLYAVGYGGYGGYGGGYGLASAVWPRGAQNVAVTGTWALAATVPADIAEAIRCEAAYRMLVTGAVGLNGVGEDIRIGDFELNTSVGALNFKLTSPLTVFHDAYLSAVRRYRLRPARAWREHAESRRMA